MYLSKLAHLQLPADSCNSLQILASSQLHIALNKAYSTSSIFEHHCSASILPKISFLQASQPVSILIQPEDFLATAPLDLLPKLHLNSLSSYNQSPSMNQT
ncbi:hypothetical protein F2Q69_00050628 [Brassica cretica]|uniref:Uncharacterized protein n=1 Tax=Brassica cretica TaxID=69181 RepID=A0A8S9PMR3_BRACR|nr:hypothetical protein F2Q69_00050628 [Brassica cretica]